MNRCIVAIVLTFVLTSASPGSTRYIIDSHQVITTPGGGQIAAIVVRKRGIATRQPTALVFTIYAEPAKDVKNAEYAADRGYAGVVAYTRGKAWSPNTVVPYEYDGRDADAVIDWIAKQPWSDGRVGMYGGSYNGFTQWAAAKHLPSALKTIVPYVANNPGNGLPMENNIFLFVNYAWAFYTTDNKYLDDALYNQSQRWRSLNQRWYESGKPYRDIPAIDGKANPLFQRWITHPSFDAYWQSMVPYKADFAKINIPVLTITGYYDDGQASALNFLKDHYKYNPRAQHYLVIGPWDHFGSQRAHKPEVLRGYPIDPVAQLDTPKLTFDWFDYIFKGAARPAPLHDRINYEVMGANTWKHASSLETMAQKKLMLFLTREKDAGSHFRLSTKRPRSSYLLQEVDFADRKTSNNDYYPFPILDKKPDLTNGFTFVSAPFEKPLEIDGFFTGKLRAVINKRDMDFGLVLYEMMSDGTLMELSYFTGRASYAQDISARHLLTPGKVATIAFDRSRLVSRRLKKGSRLLLTLNVNKNAFAQINYGTGKNVSDEDIRDAGTPLTVKWLTSSYIQIPISR